MLWLIEMGRNSVTITALSSYFMAIFLRPMTIINVSNVAVHNEDVI